MKSIAIFNNKGGVGKTTLTYHAAASLAEHGHRTLLLDLDPQSNMTLFGFTPESLEGIWAEEDDFVDDFEKARDSRSDYEHLLRSTRSVHFLLKPAEDGVSDFDVLPHPKWLLNGKLGLIPGRLSLHMFEDRLASRWSDMYRGDPLALRTVTRIRRLCHQYAEAFDFEFVLMDTSPSLGILNRAIISTCDGVVVPCKPDMFSVYGIKNIGRALERWKAEFSTLGQILPDGKRRDLPSRFVQFLGYTIYNAVKRTGQNEFDLAQAHYNYARQLPDTVLRWIPEDARTHLSDRDVRMSLGDQAVMHTHNTLPNMAQKYQLPIWRVPDCGSLEQEDAGTITGNRKQYEGTAAAYASFAKDLLRRLGALDRNQRQ